MGSTELSTHTQKVTERMQWKRKKKKQQQKYSTEIPESELMSETSQISFLFLPNTTLFSLVCSSMDNNDSSNKLKLD